MIPRDNVQRWRRSRYLMVSVYLQRIAWQVASAAENIYSVAYVYVFCKGWFPYISFYFPRKKSKKEPGFLHTCILARLKTL